MGKINWCLKHLFISFNTLFAIFGCLLIFGAMKSGAYSHELSAVGSPNLEWIWLYAISFLGISCLGIYASFYEKKILLKIFAGFMVVGMIIMLIFGIIMVGTRNKIKLSFDTKSFMKDEELRALLDGLQQSGHCCGVVSANDWGDNIPNSCKCSGFGYGGYGGYGGSECTSKPQGVSGPDRIYAQPCSKYIFMEIDSFLEIAMGVNFGFAVTALLGLLLSYMMIHQVQRHDSSGGSSIAMKDILKRPLTPDL